MQGEKGYQIEIAAYSEAISLDPNYALAFANRSLVLSYSASNASGPAVRESYEKAQADALKAIALAPDLADGHLALAFYFALGLLDFTQANKEYERALALAPGNARVLGNYGLVAVSMGRTQAGIAAARRGVVLDPLNRASHRNLGVVLYFGRQNHEAITAFQDALTLDPEYLTAKANRGLAYYALGDFPNARASCESKPDYWANQQCLALAYGKLGRHADAEGMLARMKASDGDADAYQYAEIYAQWGDTSKALDWLEEALRVRDPGLGQLKVESLLDPLRKEPRFQAIVRALKFPN
jgi:tetratricopeptide (TPR) repeat protein